MENSTLTFEAQQAKALGKIIRARRIELSFTQGELADELGYTRRTISQIEAGAPVRFMNFLTVVGALGLDLLISPRHSAAATKVRNSMTTTVEQAAPHPRVKRGQAE